MKYLVLAASMALAGTAQADPAAGLWQTEPGDTGGYLHVAMAPCGTAVCGTIKAAFDGSGAPSKAYEHLGKQLVWDMAATGGGSYSGGKIWAPDKDKTYASKMQVSGNALEVKGCVAGGMICRGQTWTRVK